MFVHGRFKITVEDAHSQYYTAGFDFVHKFLSMVKGPTSLLSLSKWFMEYCEPKS